MHSDDNGNDTWQPPVFIMSATAEVRRANAALDELRQRGAAWASPDAPRAAVSVYLLTGDAPCCLICGGEVPESARRSPVHPRGHARARMPAVLMACDSCAVVRVHAEVTWRSLVDRVLAHVLDHLHPVVSRARHDPTHWHGARAGTLEPVLVVACYVHGLPIPSGALS